MEAAEIVDYTTYRENEILPLYSAVGWSNYIAKPEMLRGAYEGALCVLAAKFGDAVIGVLRAVGDGHSILYIQDIIVSPEHQRRGIGTRLLRCVLERFPQVYQVVLSTDDQPHTVAFYESIGFTAFRKLGCEGFMMMRR